MSHLQGLQRALSARLYGQHLVSKAVINHIRGHVRKDTVPSKALVLVFHGPTGTGKNHVSRIIAEMLFREGLKSENVKLVPVTREFVHSHKISKYKVRFCLYIYIYIYIYIDIYSNNNNIMIIIVILFL